jgi:MoaA/NifB/PqqE/SkfB family radical SAM enzyme
MKKYLDFYLDEDLEVFVDICTYCNAGCPECHRTDITNGGLGKINWLPLIQWSIEEFKNAYDEEFVKAVKLWEICGTWGDPVMCKDLYEICEYILDINPYTKLTIDTNGSIRPKSWWRKIGKLSEKCKGKGYLRFDFAIEGINQEMQEKYRRKTELNKILANMKEVTDSGAKATAFCVIHKHNQDYLQEIMDLSFAYGAEDIYFTESNRFFTGPKFKFINEHGEEDVLEQANDYYKPKDVRNAQSDWKTRIDFLPQWYIDMRQEVENVEDEEDIY